MGLFWRGREECSEEAKSIAYRELDRIFGGPAYWQPIKMEQASLQQLQTLREWAETLDNRDLASAYRYWFSYFEKQITRRANDARKELRVEKMKQSAPRPPF